MAGVSGAPYVSVTDHRSEGEDRKPMQKVLAIATCAIAFAIMSVVAFYLTNKSDDFLEGLVTGMFGITGLIYVSHKLGARLF